ncbi:MAG: hypothetical protein K0S33_4243 [Bacteroidetes bacterium]|jgi:hypothetical protein|nr:hypothetical protein [Bacteroidota bacterium]
MKSYPLRKADPDFYQLVNRIANMAGIENAVEVFATDVPSSCTTLFIADGRHDKPVICYNPVFTDELEKADPLAVTAAFAHEIARYYNAGLDEKKGNHTKINADKFTGWVLWHESVQLKEAMALYNLPRFSKPFSVLGENQRKIVMKAGWIQAHDRLLLPPKRESEKRPEFKQEEWPKVKETNEAGGLLLGLAALAFLASGMSTLGE